MSLKEIEFRSSISTGNDSAIEHLFIPALENSYEYCVAVAYFTSGWIADAANGLSKFIAKGGRLKWIISPDLPQADLDAIYNAKSDFDRDLIIAGRVEILLSKMKDEPREILSWLIKDGILEIKFAVPRQGNNGIFHAKIGFFRDLEGTEIAFSGSYNQTAGANTNWERIEIYQSKSEPKRVNDIIQEWNRLWDDKDSWCFALKLEEITFEKIINQISGPRPYKVNKVNTETSMVKLRDYQEEAVTKWFDNKGHGIFLMATGSGKTITALSLLDRFYKVVQSKNSKVFVVISVPYRHLLDQWAIEAKKFGFDAIKCYESKAKWLPLAQSAIANLHLGVSNVVVLLTTYSTLSIKEFQNLCNTNLPFLFIGDEIHNAAEGNRNLMLPKCAKYRLGLTATPERNADEITATENLERYFGKVIFEFSIEDAIHNGFLTPYEYYVVRCHMDDNEFFEYVELSSKISSLFAISSDDNESLKLLLMKRARIIGDVFSKYSQLEMTMNSISEKSKSIIYCSDYSDGEVKPIEKCLSIARRTGYFPQKFTHSESTKERQNIIRQLSDGSINAVVAIKCLDEGVDIPAVETAFILASSTSLRQFIQRRGRVLRLSKGKDKAVIYDFVTLPPASQAFTDSEIKAINSLSARELERVREFSRISLNSHANSSIMEELENLRRLS